MTSQFKAPYVLVTLTDEQKGEFLGSGSIPFDSHIVYDNMVLFSSSGGKHIALRNGMHSLQKKMSLSSPPERLWLGGRLPDAFYRLLTEQDIDEGRAVAYGMLTNEILKATVKDTVRKCTNQFKANIVLQKGVTKSYIDGDIPANQILAYKMANELLKAEQEDEKFARLDVPFGARVSFSVPVTGKKIKIVSQKKEDAGEVSVPAELELVNGEVDVSDTARDIAIVKRKHYFLYSCAPGYGKSSFLQSLTQRTNTCIVPDCNNFLNVRPRAQFLAIDEFDHKSKIALHDFKALTGGNGSSFAGNCKTFGQSFTPRDDVQIIVASNSHLFQCVGSGYDASTKRRCMDYNVAKQLFDRFYIHKLDDEIIGDLEFGASCLPTEDSRYQPVCDEVELRHFVYENADLVQRYIQVIDQYVRSRKRKLDVDDEKYLGIDICNSNGVVDIELFRRFLNNLIRYKSWCDEIKP